MPDIKFEIGTGTEDKIEIEPLYDYQQSIEKIQTVHKLKGGGHKIYVWGKQDRISLSLEYVSQSNADDINTWWKSGTELILYVTVGVVETTYNIKIMGKATPLRSFSKPYTDQYKGKLILEGYDGL